MAKTVSTVRGLENEVQRRINIALHGDAADAVKECLQKHVESDVLGVYSPKEYERRGAGGLEGEGNIKATVRDKVLTVKDVATIEGPRIPGYEASTSSQTEFAKLIEGYGKGVANPWGARPGAWMKPRPFVTNAKAEVANGNSNVHKRIVKAVKNQFPK